MSGSEFDERLAAGQEVWNEGGEPQRKINGRMMLQIQSAQMGETAKEDPAIKLQYLVIEENEFQGETIYDGQYPVSHSFSARNCRTWIEALGYEVPASTDDLPDLVAQIDSDAPTIVGNVKTNKGGFQNVTVEKLLGSGDAPPKPTPKPGKKAALTEEPAETEEEAVPPAFDNGDEVTFDSDGEDISGVFTGLNDDDDSLAEVDVDGTVWNVPVSALAAAATEETEPDGPDLDNLKELCQVNEIDVDDDDTVETCAKKIAEWTWDKDDLVEDEIKLLESVGAVFKKKVAPAPKPKPKPKSKPKKKKVAKKKAAKKGRSRK